MNATTLNDLYAQFAANATGDNTNSLHDGVRQYVAHMTRSHRLNDADDATGDVVTEVWRSLLNFRGESSFSTWLHRLSKSAIIDRIRSERRRPNLVDEDGKYGSGGTDTDTSIKDADDLTALTEDERQLVRQLIQCPDYDELAEQLGMSNIALRSRFARIRKKCEAQRCVSVSADD